MVRFAHLADCHLGGWRQQELQELNFQTFQKAIKLIISEKLDFVLMCGDLFDSAYPPIEILKETFAEFRKLSDAEIPVYLIAGSHDFSASGKTFLDVLEKAGFCKNVANYTTQEDGSIKLKPYIHESFAIYGYPGRKSGMEINDLKKVYFDSVHPYTIFMAHTTITEVAIKNMDSIDKRTLPLADYYALGHIHQVKHIQEGNQHYVYPGPIFPNNFQELADLKSGSFQITEITDKLKTHNIKLPIKEIAYIEIELKNGLTATDEIIQIINKHTIRDKIVLLKLTGNLSTGKTGDIQFNRIEEAIKRKEAYSYLRNISQLKTPDMGISLLSEDLENIDNIEKTIIEEYSRTNPHNFNKYLPELMHALSIEKNEDEKIAIFEDRLLSELKMVLEIDKII